MECNSFPLNVPWSRANLWMVDGQVPVGTVRAELAIRLYMVSLQNPDYQNSEIVENTREAGAWMKLLILFCIL